jgi:hypothetical protein
MKSLPLAFSTEMVHSTLEDLKTQTRRTNGLEAINKNPDDWQFEWADYKLDKPWRFTQISSINQFNLTNRTFTQEAIKCPYGSFGDVLWVREEHKITFSEDKSWVFVDFRNDSRYQYRMKHLDPKLAQRLLNRKTIGKWQRARFLPKAFARVQLAITKIRVQRLQDISELDAISEGVKKNHHGFKKYTPHIPSHFAVTGVCMSTAYASFQTLWISIYGEESWDANPWVWVIEFKRIDNLANS